MLKGRLVVGSPSATSAARTAGAHADTSLTDSGATLYLYSAGISGYGSAAALLATTNTDPNGGWSFVSGGTGSNGYTCPTYTFNSPDGTNSITKDGLVYIVAKGGTIGGNANTSAAYMLALGDCQHLLANLPSSLVINEATTVAGVFALAQYMSPNYTSSAPGGLLGTSTSYLTGYGTGANAGYTSTGVNKSVAVTPLGYTGLANAFATVNNLVDNTQGYPRFSFTASGTGTGNGITMTGTPEQAKLNTIANILAACTQSGTGSSSCTTLFASAAPPISSATTSLGSGVTFNTATDTLQAAYYMAVNPTDNTTFGANTAGTTTNLGKLYSLVPPTTPFQPALTAQPTDWTVSIAYNSTGNCGTDTTTSPFIGAQPWAAAADLSGNIAMINGNSSTGITTDTLVTLSNTGTPSGCYLGGAYSVRGVLFDVVGNLWASVYGTETGLYEVTPGSSAPTAWTTTATPYQIVADGTGNVFYTTLSYTPSGGSAAAGLFEFPGAASASAPVPNGDTELPGTVPGVNDLYFAAADASGKIWVPNSNVSATIGAHTYGSNYIYVWYPASSSPTPLTYTQNTVTHYLAYDGAVSPAITSSGGVILGNSACCASTGDGQNTVTTAVVSATNAGPVTSSTDATYASKFGAGVLGTKSIALDGAGNIWTSTFLAAAPVVTGNTTSGIFALAEQTSSGTALSPNITGTASTCAAAGETAFACELGGGFQKPTLGPSRQMAIDISGNIWVPSDLTLNAAGYNTSDLVEVVGAAVPVVPLAVAARDNKLATKP